MYKKSKNNEIKILNIIQNFFNLDIKLFENKYSPFDYYSNDVLFELKSRYNKYNKYETTMIPYHKIMMNKENKKMIFLFLFYDGLYYYEYNENDYLNNDIFIKYNHLSRYDRGKNEINDYLFINIKILKLIDNNISSN